MFVAGGILWANILEGHLVHKKEFGLEIPDFRSFNFAYAYGWPFRAVAQYFHYYGNNTNPPIYFIKSGFALDIVCGIGCLVVVWLIFELWVHAGNKDIDRTIKRSDSFGAPGRVSGLIAILISTIILMGVNLQERWIRSVWLENDSLARPRYGWPLPAVTLLAQTNSPLPLYSVVIFGAIIDFTIATIILLLVWYFSQSWVRKRALKKGA